MKLSVLILTYNHARYIEQAITSALLQETAFDFEVVVADDASTDGTAAIVERLAARHGARLRLLPRDRHLGVHENFFDGYANCRGSYLALLDGDDYWLSRHKLQRQVNFLDQHAECAVCFHNVLTVYDNGDPEQLAVDDARREFSGIEDLLIENFVPTSSVLYRHGLLKQLPEWSRSLITWDWVLHLLHAQYGRVGYLTDTMAVSRHHAGGLWRGAEPAARTAATLQMLEHLTQHFNGKYEALIRASMARWQAAAKLDDLHRACRQAEGEWVAQAARLQMERAAALNEVRMRLRDAERERDELERALERSRTDAAQAIAEKELAGREMSALRRLVEDQRAVLDELRVTMEANASREYTVGAETIRGLAAVDQRLTEIHRWMDVQRTRELVHAVVPESASVLVVSKGDPELLQLRARRAGHFPQTNNGIYAGAHPATGEEAIAHLEALRRQGAEYLVFPGSSLWWLDYYAALRQHLNDEYAAVLHRDGECLIFDVRRSRRRPTADQAESTAVGA